MLVVAEVVAHLDLEPGLQDLLHEAGQQPALAGQLDPAGPGSFDQRLSEVPQQLRVRLCLPRRRRRATCRKNLLKVSSDRHDRDPVPVRRLRRGPSGHGAYTSFRTVPSNLHGDVVTSATPGATQYDGAVRDADEYGNSKTGPAGRYSWLGAKQRSAEALGSTVVMGVRLFSPVTGRFLSWDPVPGGNATTYAYPTDPVNMLDLDGRVGVGDGSGKTSCTGSCLRRVKDDLAQQAREESKKAKLAKALSIGAHVLGYMFFCTPCGIASVLMSAVSTTLLKMTGQRDASMGQLFATAFSAALLAPSVKYKIGDLVKGFSRVGKFVNGLPLGIHFNAASWAISVPKCGTTPWCGS